MRLVSYTRHGVTRAGVLHANEDVIDVNRALAARLCDEGVQRPELAADALNPASMIDLLAVGQPALDAIEATRLWLDSGALSRDELVANGSLVPASEVRLAAPIPRPGKVMAIGINYKAHAAEMERELPDHPTVFTKVSSCITGVGDPIHAPVESQMLDWEGEFCVVIGKYARHVAAADALDYVAGYMNGNDVTVRDWQRHTATWMMGKSWDTHGPTGPWILTADEVPDPSALHLKTYLNDVEKQSAPTSDLLFDIPTIIEYLSTAFTLEPGDVIFTGTPSGVGQAREPQEWMKAGDTVRVEITGLGSLINPVISEPGR
ncbi:MAG: fumarylacetoacetate hydrolase family protein [Chloroflexi bacterium]|nr:fumarylacetoacetate hydrolase family protein [Chloroflexota bacterium]MDA1145426.1 fumarylacetoacetate hydrolase family protein [Chloroflexota bacterium]